LQGIFYWDLGNDVKTSNPYSLPKASNYALNCNVDTLVTEVVINHPTGIRHTKTDEAKVSVRLSSDGKHLTVDSPVSEVSTLRIFSSSGQQIVTSQGSTAVTTSLPKGIYLLSIRLKDGTMVNKKFAKNL
jgi:hypothetical protein